MNGTPVRKPPALPEGWREYPREMLIAMVERLQSSLEITHDLFELVDRQLARLERRSER